MKILSYNCNTCFEKILLDKKNYYIHNNFSWVEDEVVLFVSHKFTLINDMADETINVTPGFMLYARNVYPLRKGFHLVSLSKNSDKLYLISDDEIKYYTIPIVNDNLEFEIIKITENIFKKKNREILFSINGIHKDYYRSYLSLIFYAKTLIELEDVFVMNHFIDNIVNILNDCKIILNKELSDNEKNHLIQETLKLLKKLYSTVLSISPLNTDKICTTKMLLDEVEKENEEIQKRIEEEQRRLKSETESFKENYLTNLKYRSELLDDFNYPL